MGYANPIRTLGDYSRPSHEGYRNTIELPKGNNVDSLDLDDDDTTSLQHLSIFIQQSSASTTVVYHLNMDQFIPTQHYSYLLIHHQPLRIHHSSDSTIIYISSQCNIKPHLRLHKISYQTPQVTNSTMTDHSPLDSSFVVLVFSLRDDLIACLNKAMDFLIVVASSRFPSTNNQLRTSSNPRNHTTIQDGRVTVQQVNDILARTMHQPKRLKKCKHGVPKWSKLFRQSYQTMLLFRLREYEVYFDSDDTRIMQKRSHGPTFSNYGSDVISEAQQDSNDLKYFEINDLKAQLQDKDTTICKLKDTIKSLRENTKEENVNHDKCELEPINKELENSVAKLLSENERLCNEINHVKQVFKDHFDLIKQTRVCHKEHSDSLINKLNLKSAKNEDLKAQIQDKVFVITSLKNDLLKLKGKEIVENVVHIPSSTTIAPGMFKLDLVPLPLRELDFACKHATRIQELLIYVQDTYPNAITPSTKKVVVTPMNNVKKVRFTHPLTSSSNIKQVKSSKTSDSNTTVLSSTEVKCSTSNCGSKPPGNKKNDRISQTPSRNMKNKVEAQPRKVNKTNRVVKPICDVDVKHSLSNANSGILCATYNKSMFDSVHDKCLLDFIVLWYLDSGCSKHMTRNRSQLMNFVSKFLGTVRFGNDQIARIMGYGDYQLGNVIILRVYYVEGLGHNMFSVGQFCDADLEVAFRKNTCFIHNLEGVDQLSGSRDSNL
ncbi:hypothetical protein Tco_1437437 [Tanacetum coccineum]